MDNTAQWPRCWFTMAEKLVHKPLPQNCAWCLRVSQDLFPYQTVSLCVCSLRGRGLVEISEDTSPSKKLQHNSEMRESRAKKQKRFVSSKSGILIIVGTFDLSVNKGKMQSIAQKSVPSLAFPQLGHFLINSSDFLFSSAVRFFTSASFSISSHRCPPQTPKAQHSGFNDFSIISPPQHIPLVPNYY